MYVIDASEALAEWSSSGSNSGMFSLSSQTRTLALLTKDGTSQASFYWGFDGLDGSLSVTMTVDQITNNPSGSNTASGHNGTFTFVDVYGSKITGTFSGTWSGGDNTAAKFTGVSTDLVFTGTTGSPPVTTFTGHTGDDVDMTGFTALPRSVTLGLGVAGVWFDDSPSSFPESHAYLNVTAVPVPGAVLLGFLGLGAAGLGLRRLA
jgi:hypothetical protein